MASRTFKNRSLTSNIYDKALGGSQDVVNQMLWKQSGSWAPVVAGGNYNGTITLSGGKYWACAGLVVYTFNYAISEANSNNYAKIRGFTIPFTRILGGNTIVSNTGLIGQAYGGGDYINMYFSAQNPVAADYQGSVWVIGLCDDYYTRTH